MLETTYFSNMQSVGFLDKVIFLDIDGTLVTDGSTIVPEDALVRVVELVRTNAVYLTSNNKDEERNRALSTIIGIPLASVRYKKPDKRIVQDSGCDQTKPRLVIGDKYCIDGLFAKNINADFIKVKSLQGSRDSCLVRGAYLFDAFFGKLLYTLWNT